VIHISRS